LRLANRDWRIQIDDTRYTGLDLIFSVEKSIRHTPNKASIKVLNLSAATRAKVDELSLTRRRGTGRIRVVLEAGYKDRIGVILQADLRNGKSYQDGPTWVTELTGEDAGRSYQWSRVNRTFDSGATVLQVARACVEAMGVGTGNLEEALASARLAGGGNTFLAGTVVSGSAPQELLGLLRSCGYTYSVQDGVIQVLRRGEAIQRTAVSLSDGTGLVGNPQKNLDGTVAIRALLNPDIYPGRQLRVTSNTLSGTFRARKVTYQGETSGVPWYCEVEAEEVTSA
jgi:hypothetical protein